jgi:hypothetical protein
MANKLGEPFVYKQHGATKAFGDIRFRYYPSGFTPDEHNQIIYVRYKPASKQNYDQNVKVLSADIDYVHFDLPDRELMFSKNNFALGEGRPLNKIGGSEPWHKAISLTPATSVSDDLPFDRYMINPHAYTDRTELRIRDPKTVYDSNKIIISDSSGFQLGHGFSLFIHPGDLAKFYNNNADEGVTLDIPSRKFGDDKEILKYTAHVQNMNTTYLKDRVRKDFRIATVIHGLNLDLMDYFRERIESYDSDFPIACVSGMLRFNLVEIAHRTLYAINKGPKYQQYHMLGVGDPIVMALLSYIAYMYKKAGRDILLTADSSTPIMCASNMVYFSQSSYYSGLLRTKFGIKLDANKEAPGGRIANPHRRFASSDPISQVIGGYQDVISAYNIAATRTYIKYLNHMEINRYLNLMCHYANVLPHREYKQLLAEQFKRSAHGHALAMAMDYLEMAFNDGMEKAFIRFKYYMPLLSGERSLHSFPAMQENAGQVELREGKEGTKKQLVKVIKNYMEFHKTGKAPTEYKNKDHKANQLNIKYKI